MNPHELNGRLRDAALRYAEMGYAVFPCVPSGKAPVTSHGFKDATTDSAKIDAWWEQHPRANIGIATAGLLVVDVDGPENAWPNDLENASQLASAALSLTPRGGRHFIFRQPPGKTWRNTTGKLAPKVDTRGQGGYILVAPSVVDGKPYQWAESMELDTPENLAEPPAWLVELLDGLATGSSQGACDASERADGNVIPDGQRNATLVHLGGTMRRVGMSEAEILAALVRVNQDRCNPPLDEPEVRRIASSVARYEPDQITVAVVEDHYAQDFGEKPEPYAQDVSDPGAVPEHLLRIPGFISEIMDHTLATAPYPQLVLAFSGALSLQSVLAGRKVRDIADNRTNLYILALANSGTGKDHPRKINQQVIVEAGLSNCLGDSFASGEGLEDRLLVTPSMLFQTDEMDGLILAISKARDARHENILNFLLKAYTFSNGIYVMRARAGREHAIIDQPSLCLLGTAIPKYYYEALTMRMLNNGFFARLFILDVGKRNRGQTPRVKDLPKRVCETAGWWADFKPGAQNGNLSDWHPRPALVESTEQAERCLSEFREYADDEYAKAEEKDDPAAMAIWARAYERARKLALVYAVSESNLKPQIGEAAARWACELVDYHTKRMLFMAGQYVPEGEFDAKCKRFLQVLTRWRKTHGDRWMPHWELARRLKWSDTDIEEVCKALRGQEKIAFEIGSTELGGKPSKRYRLK